MTNPFDKLTAAYKNQDFVKQATQFASQVVSYFPKNSNVLELGSGTGQDSRYFASLGHNILSTDFSDKALELNIEKSKHLENIDIQKLDFTQLFPFSDNTFDVVYAHLSVQYFNSQITTQIFSEVKRVLKANGIFCAACNSIVDEEYDKGEKIEQDFFQIGEKTKRFFSTESLIKFGSGFEIIVCDLEGQQLTNQDGQISKCARFIGRNR